MNARFFALLVVIILASLGCDSVAQAPISFPARAYEGETVSFAISTDFDQIQEVDKAHDVSEENLELRVIEHSSGVECSVETPRSVIAATSARPTGFAEQNGVGEVLIAVLDLPDPLTPPCVAPTTIRIESRRVGTPELIGSEVLVEVLGPSSAGNGPTAFWPNNVLNQLRPRPALRLRAVLPGFELYAPVGSLQFDLTYPRNRPTRLR